MAGKTDLPLVKKLMRQAFASAFGAAVQLNYSGLGWDDAEITKLAEVLGSAATPKLEVLLLDSNKFGDEGMKELALRFLHGPQGGQQESTVPNLTRLSLTNCKVHERGAAEITGMLRSGAAPLLKELAVWGNPFCADGKKGKEGGGNAAAKKVNEVAEQMVQTCKLWDIVCKVD